MSYQSLRESLDSKDEFDTMQRPDLSARHALRISTEKPARLAIRCLSLILTALLISNIATVVYLARPRNSPDSQVYSMAA